MANMEIEGIADAGLLAWWVIMVYQAEEGHALEDLTAVFVAMLQQAEAVNAANNSADHGFTDIGTVISDELMRQYKVCLRINSPFRPDQFRDHCDWLRRVVFSSLKVALREFGAQPSWVQMSVIELISTMANDTASLADTIDHDMEEYIMNEEEEEEEEEEAEAEDEEEETEEEEEEETEEAIVAYGLNHPIMPWDLTTEEMSEVEEVE